MAVVLDTSLIWGKLYPQDRHHARATALFDQLVRGRHGVLVTNDAVYAEATSIAARSEHRAGIIPRLDAFFFGPDSLLDVHRFDQRAFGQARDRLLAHPSRGLSLTDWSLVVLAERTRAEAIATFDDRLGQAYKRQLP